MSFEYVMMQVIEQGLPSLANGAGLKIQSHRGSGVQIPSPAPFLFWTIIFINWNVSKSKFICYNY